MVTWWAVARLGVDRQALEADGAATPAASAVPPRVHPGQGGLGFGKRGLCGHGEFVADLAVRGDVRSAGRFDDIVGALGNVSELLTSEQAIFVQTCPQNGEFRGIEAMIVDCRDLMGHDGSSSTVTTA
jgi:hypothetical protein